MESRDRRMPLFDFLIKYYFADVTTIVFETPEQATFRYNIGGQWVQGSDDLKIILRALVLLDQAKEIYLKNGKMHDAAYAAIRAAEGRLKLIAQGKIEFIGEARDLLDFAEHEFRRANNLEMLVWAEHLKKKYNIIL